MQFRYANKLNMFGITVGLLMSILTGTVIPILALLFGFVADELVYYSLTIYTSNTSSYFCNTSEEGILRYITSSDPAERLKDEIIMYTYYTIALGTGYLIASFLSKAFLGINSQIQANHMRQALFKCILSRDIKWYDLNASTELHSHLTRYV